MADNNGQTNPTSVTVVPVQNIIPSGQQSGTAAAPLASGARVNFGTLGQLPTRPTPITPVRVGPRGRR